MSDGLNKAQRDAVKTLSGPLLVLAGAGSGKTRVVTFRIAELIRTGIAPERILAVTFTNKAAAEMQQRITGVLGRNLKQRPQISTFHSHCVEVLERHITKLGYPKNFAICDRGDQESLARRVLREIDVPGQRMRPGDLLFQISTWKSHGVRPKAAASQAASDREHLAAMAYRRYQESLKSSGLVDFDDLLLCTEELLHRKPNVRREEASRFDHLLVDEYQDTNGSQYRIVKALALEHRNLCVVGDDDQSIYGWRGAEVRHILRFDKDWPDAKVVRLEDNYRSTQAILEMANRLIACNLRRYPKTLRAARQGGVKPRIQQYRDETAEAREVVADLKRCLGKPGCEPRDFAILFRTNEQPRTFEMELRKAHLPYVLLGETSFYDRKEVRDVLAYIKLLQSPRDEMSLRRVINTPPRGVGPSTLGTLQEEATRRQVNLWDAATDEKVLASIKPASARGLERLNQVLNEARAKARQKNRRELLAHIVGDMLERIDYRSEIERLYDDPNQREARWAGVEDVLRALREYETRASSPNVLGFLRDQALDNRETDNDKEQQLQQNAVALMTLHSAKGLEFPYVYMVGLEEGLLPHRRSVSAEGDAIDEERRLCYVGITRAQESLTLSLALTRVKWGKPRKSTPSRFLYEMIGRPVPVEELQQ